MRGTRRIEDRDAEARETLSMSIEWLGVDWLEIETLDIVDR